MGNGNQHLMLSELLRYELVDEAGKRARLQDLSYPVKGEDYPTLTRLYFKENGDLLYLKWSSIKEFDSRRSRVQVDDLISGYKSSDEHDRVHVLLKEEVLDSLVIDLLHRRTTRATDVQLSLSDGYLQIVGVDSGFEAMLRRITRGRLGGMNADSLFDWKYVEFLRGDPTAVESGAGYRRRIGRLPAGEIAQICEYIPYLHAAELLTLLADEKAADVLEAMSLERQLQVIEEFKDEETVELVRRMSPDLAADIVGRLQIGTMKMILQRLPPDRSEKIVELLRYPEDSVGGVMINDLVVCTAETKVAEARKNLHEALKDLDFIDLVFVVTDEDKRDLVGSISLRDLLTADEERKLGDLINPYLETLKPFERASDAAYRIVGGQLAAMPVTNARGEFIGAMTIDAAIAQIVPPTSGLKGLRVFS